MFNPNFLMKACLATAFAFGLAACGSSSDPVDTSSPPADPDLMPEMPPVASPVEGLDLAALKAAIGPEETIAPYDDAADSFTVDAGEVTQNPDTADDFAESDTTPASIADWAGKIYTRATEEDDATTDADESVNEMVVSYTDIEDPTAAAYADHYISDNVGTSDGQLGAGISEIVNSADDGLNVITFGTDVSSLSEHIDVEAFPSGDRQTFAIEDDLETTGDDADERVLTGNFHGVPGNYTCGQTSCSVTTNEDGEVVTFTQGWTFMPDEQEEGDDAYMVAGAVPDPDYLDLGVWLTTSADADGTIYSVVAFAQGNRDYGSVALVEGTARYAGPATGLYVRKTFTEDGESTPVASGQFTATAALTALFGGGDIGSSHEDSITGTVTDFMDAAGSPIDADWTVMLMRNVNAEDVPESNIDDTEGTFMGTTTGDGSFAGTFHGINDPDTDEVDHPSALSGTFDAHFSNGDVVGAFGGNLQDDE